VASNSTRSPTPLSASYTSTLSNTPITMPCFIGLTSFPLFLTPFLLELNSIFFSLFLFLLLMFIGLLISLRFNHSSASTPHLTILPPTFRMFSAFPDGLSNSRIHPLSSGILSTLNRPAFPPPSLLAIGSMTLSRPLMTRLLAAHQTTLFLASMYLPILSQAIQSHQSLF